MSSAFPAADPNQIPTQWGPPYLLYLGNARDDLAAKTARGLAFWRPTGAWGSSAAAVVPRPWDCLTWISPRRACWVPTP